MQAKLMTDKGKIVKETDNVLEWFPELSKFLEKFNVEHIAIRMKNKKERFLISNE